LRVGMVSVHFCGLGFDSRIAGLAKIANGDSEVAALV